MTELATMTYQGMYLWADAVKKAGTRRPHEGDRGARAATPRSTGRPARPRIDPQTHHTILDVYIGEARDKKFEVLEKFSQQKPADTQAVCDLKKNPNENKQYVIDVKT